MAPWGGLTCCLSAAALYLLGISSGRDAQILKTVTRVNQLKELGAHLHCRNNNKECQGRFSAIVPLMVCWGISFMYVVGSFVTWRTLALVATVSGLLQLLLLFFIPESPRWLAKVGREKEIKAVLLSLRGNKADISDEVAEIKV